LLGQESELGHGTGDIAKFFAGNGGVERRERLGGVEAGGVEEGLAGLRPEFIRGIGQTEGGPLGRVPGIGFHEGGQLLDVRADLGVEGGGLGRSGYGEQGRSVGEEVSSPSDQ
jgi:hypothetical protein